MACLPDHVLDLQVLVEVKEVIDLDVDVPDQRPLEGPAFLLAAAAEGRDWDGLGAEVDY